MHNVVNQEEYSFLSLHTIGKKSKQLFLSEYYKLVDKFKKMYDILSPLSTQKKGASRGIPKSHWLKHGLGILGWWIDDDDDFESVFTDQHCDEEDGLTFQEEFWVNMLEKNRNFMNASLSFYIFYLSVSIAITNRSTKYESYEENEGIAGVWSGNIFSSQQIKALVSAQMRFAVVSIVIFAMLIGTLSDLQHSSFNYKKIRHCLRNYKYAGEAICLYKLLELLVQIFYFFVDTRNCSDIDYLEDISATYASIVMMLFKIASTCESFIFAIVPMPSLWYCPSICVISFISFTFHAFTCLIQTFPLIQRLLLLYRLSYAVLYSTNYGVVYR